MNGNMDEMTCMQDLLDLNFTKLGEINDDGQGSQVLMARKATKNAWMYLIVDMTDDGYIRNITGLAAGKMFSKEEI